MTDQRALVLYVEEEDLQYMSSVADKLYISRSRLGQMFIRAGVERLKEFAREELPVMLQESAHTDVEELSEAVEAAATLLQGLSSEKPVEVDATIPTMLGHRVVTHINGSEFLVWPTTGGFVIADAKSVRQKKLPKWRAYGGTQQIAIQEMRRMLDAV